MEDLDIVKELIKEEKYADAYFICTDLKHKDDIMFIKEIIRIYKKQKRYLEALELCDSYSNIDIIDHQKIDILISKGIYSEAIKLCDKYPLNEKIQSQKIKIMILRHEYKEALELCNKFSNNEVIISQKITALMKLYRIEDAKSLCEKYPNNVMIQSQLIRMLNKDSEYDKALEICRRFPDNELIQAQLVNILINKLEIDKAFEMFEKYPNNKYINIQKVKLLEKIDESNIKDILFTKIYCDKCSLEDINNSILDSWTKELLTVTYLDKTNRKLGLEFIKNKKNKYKDNDIDKYKILNIFYGHLSNKKNTCFDVLFYEKYIKCNIDTSLIESLNGSDKDENNKVKKLGRIIN